MNKVKISSYKDLLFHAIKPIFYGFLFTLGFFLPQLSPISLFFLFLFLFEGSTTEKIIFFFAHSFFFYTPLTLWLFYYELNQNNVIFYYFIIFLIIITIITTIIAIVTKNIFQLFFPQYVSSILQNTSIFASLYYSIGYVYLPKAIAPNFYPLTSLAWFQSYGLPFFNQEYLWAYLIILQLFIFYISKNKKTKILFFVFLCALSFSYKKDRNYYWLKEKGHNYDHYIEKEYFIFPEAMFTVHNQEEIDKLISLAKRKNKNIIAGISWETIENGNCISKHGVLTISKTGEMFIREKNHYLRFTETKNQDYILNKKETKSNEDSVLICSELFLQQPKQLLKNKIIIASIMWTKTPYTKWYKNVMIALYDLHTMS